MSLFNPCAADQPALWTLRLPPGHQGVEGGLGGPQEAHRPRHLRDQLDPQHPRTPRRLLRSNQGVPGQGEHPSPLHLHSSPYPLLSSSPSHKINFSPHHHLTSSPSNLVTISPHHFLTPRLFTFSPPHQTSDHVVEQAHQWLHQTLTKTNCVVKDLESPVHGERLFRGVMRHNAYTAHLMRIHVQPDAQPAQPGHQPDG